MKNPELPEDQLGEMTKEDLGRLFEQLTEDPKKVFISQEGFKLLSSTLTVWRPDLQQKMVELTDEFQTLSKLDPPFTFDDARILELMGKYSDLIDEIIGEIELRKESIELLKKG